MGSVWLMHIITYIFLPIFFLFPKMSKADQKLTLREAMAEVSHNLSHKVRKSQLICVQIFQ